MSKGKSLHWPRLVYSRPLLLVSVCLFLPPIHTHTQTEPAGSSKMRLSQMFQVITTTRQPSQLGGWQGNYRGRPNQVFYPPILMSC